MTTPQHLPHQRPPVPRGWRRRLARLPIAFFRVGLGPLFGKRLLLLHHTGRTSGLDRRVVLEVIAYNAEEGRLILASGFGPNAAWYQNLRTTPKTTIQIGNHHYAVTAHFLSSEEGGDVMARYAPAHPRTARRLCSFMGFDVDGSTRSYQQAGRHIPFVRLDAAPDQHLP
ncbi:nitroreductase family deazaflavin-dependent oxidoreductase [Streptomyces sp. NPDC050439]|uniref:nitroreductase family deazaflavin-dependent oxidoreductase n=1 Tax=unclassified Streptomyces TaxID=2593676 RepID=UPI003420E180